MTKKLFLPLWLFLVVVWSGLPAIGHASSHAFHPATSQIQTIIAPISSQPAPSFTRNLQFLNPDSSSPPNLYFDRLTAADGLSFSPATTILQDQQGFMWFGTRYGLNKYDGFNFTLYNLTPNAPDPWFGNAIRFLYQDHSGDLWIGTFKDLVRRDIESGEFIHYKYGAAATQIPGEWPVYAIGEDSNGDLWVGAYNGLYRYEPSTDTFTGFLKKQGVSQIYRDRQGGLWIGTTSGLWHSGPGSQGQEEPVFDHYTTDEGYIYEIQEDRQGALWVSTLGQGIKRLDLSTSETTRFQYDPDDPNSLSSNIVSSILLDDANRLWVGTDHGLDLYDPTTGGFFHFKNDPDDPHSLSSDQVNDLYQDRSGVLWIATLAGINKLNQNTSRFTHYQRGTSQPSLSDSMVEAVYEDSHGILWIGTVSGGLNRLDRKSGTLTVYRHDPADPTSLSSDEVSKIYEDKAGVLWIGSDGGLDRYDPVTETFEHIGVLRNDVVSAIVEDQQGNLWVGYWGGVLRSERGASFRTFTSPKPIADMVQNNRVNDIYIDRTGAIWISTQDNGLFRMDPAAGGELEPAVVHFPTDANDPKSPGTGSVMSFYEDTQGTLWIGSVQDGLVRFDRDSQTFTRYIPNTGTAQSVSCIQADAQGFLWMGTRLGLARFDPRSETFSYFDARDGVLVGENLTCDQNDQGEMFFGGLQGLSTFFPNQIRDNPIPPPVVITALNLKNQALRTDLFPDEQIELSYQENYLSFDFAALDYTAPDKNQYAYKMEGLDADWIDAGTRRHADYPDLKPGTYTFRVKASNDSGVWNEQGAAVRITITPPFWQTGWFLGLLGLAAVGIVAGGTWLRVRGLETHSRELERQVGERTGDLEQKTFELQLRTAEIDQRRQELEALLVENARLYEKSQELAVLEERARLARELHDAVTQTLFSASLVAEALPATWEKDPHAGRGLLQELRSLSRGALAEMRTLLLELRPAALLESRLDNLVRELGEAASGKEGIPVSVQVQGYAELPPDVHIALYRVTQEALNNVVKHARAHQVTVRLCYTVRDQTASVQTTGSEQPIEPGLSVLLSISDDGRGFDPARISHERLGLGIMQERAQAIGALLTIESQPGHGTQVTVLWKQEEV